MNDIYSFSSSSLSFFFNISFLFQALKSEELDGFFDQLASYQLALDLLYEKERYEDVIDVFRDLQNKRLQGTKFPKNCFMIAIAACYKMVGCCAGKERLEVFVLQSYLPLFYAFVLCVCLYIAFDGFIKFSNE